MTEPNQPRFVVLSSGRRLAYAEYGDPRGVPVLHFNGSGGSRLDRPSDENMLQCLGIRFISTDRPGHGLSDPVTDRRLLDWPVDVCAVADELMIDRFFVEGWSAGGAYALACAHELPFRVIACATLSGVAPYRGPEHWVGMDPEIAAWMRNARNAPERVLAERQKLWAEIECRSAAEVGTLLVSSLPGDGTAKDDLTVMGNETLQTLLGANIKEGYRQGPSGPAQDDIAVNSDWNMALGSISVPITIWQGERDANVPVSHGLSLHKDIQSSEFVLVPEMAHLFPLVIWRDILEKLVSTGAD